MGKKIVQHRIFDLAVTLIFISVMATLRLAFWPTASEAVGNVATPIGSILHHWQQSVPVIASILWCVLLFIVGLGVGRQGVRYSIYPAYTLMGIPVFGVLASAVVGTTDLYVASAAMVIMYLAMKSMLRFIMRTERFSDLSLSMLYFGLLPLIYSPAALLYAALPVMMLFVRASWRDMLVTIASLLLPPAALCYWKWCAGGEFKAPAVNIYNSMFASADFRFFESLNAATIILLGIILVMIFCTIALTVSDRYSIKVKSRVAIRFSALLAIVFAAMFCLPSATSVIYVLIAIPVALIVPLFFVRMGIGFTETLYRVMLLAAVVNIVVMAF